MLARQEQVLQLRIAGLSQVEIARRLGVSQSQISEDLKRAFNALAERCAHEQEHFARLDLARMDAMLEALWPAVASGDTKACAVALKVLERRARLLGLDKPARQEIELSAPSAPDEIRRELEQALAQRGQLDFPKGGA
jgi:transcriptional regulator with XRE-family HTH domain